MAAFQNHFRSISLPARLHPINSSTYEAELQKLKASAFSQASPITSETILSNLIKLADLYNSGNSTEEESLEGSVELLDCCSTIRELVQMIKENVQALQSSFRRKGPECSSIHNYFCIRKKMNKCIAKCLKKLRNGSSNTSLNGLTVAIFKGILVFLSYETARPGGWNLVSRLMLTKSAKDHSVVSELGCVDFALSTLVQGKGRNNGDLDKQMSQKSLQNLDFCIEGIEAGLERLFRELIQSRVRLLNILTDH